MDRHHRAALRALTTQTVLGLLLGVAGPLAAPSDAAAANGQLERRYSASLRQAVRDLPVAVEHRAGYVRSKFTHWVDADSDRCDTREEVLVQESRVAAEVGSGCAVRSGRWVSYYDRVTVTEPGRLDIDHMVPLAEAWDSGAHAWDAATRKRFANDLGDRRSLAAVTAASNRSKSDADPGEWLPRHDRCRYAAEYTAVKLRWRLNVDARERTALVGLADSCAGRTVTVTRATTLVPPTEPPASGYLALAAIASDPAGPDTAAKLNAEWVKVVNTSGASTAMTGWRLRDAAGATYVFPATTVAARGAVVVHSGAGADGAGHRYADWGWTWNNAGDTATLADPSGAVVDVCGYTAGSGATTC